MAPTSIAIWCPSPVFGRRRHRLDLVPDERLDHLGVPLEAAAGQHDAAAGTDPAGAVRALDDDADHRAGVVGDQLDRGGGGAHLDAARRPAPLSSGAISPPPLARQTSRCALGQFLGPDLAAPLLGEADLLRRDPRARGDLPRQFLAELGAGRVRLDRAGAREVPDAGDAVADHRVVVVELNVRLGVVPGGLQQVLEHLRGGVDVDLEQLGVGGAAVRQAGDVGERVLAAVPVLDEAVVRDPHVAAGHRGRAADELVLLDDHGARAAAGGEQRRGQRSPAAADHDHVEDLVPLVIRNSGRGIPGHELATQGFPALDASMQLVSSASLARAGRRAKSRVPMTGTSRSAGNSLFPCAGRRAKLRPANTATNETDTDAR